METFKQFLESRSVLKSMPEADQQRYADLGKRFKAFLKQLHNDMDRRTQVGGYMYHDDSDDLSHVEIEVGDHDDPEVLQFKLVPFLVRKLIKQYELPLTISTKEPPELKLNTLNRHIVRIYFDMPADVNQLLAGLPGFAIVYAQRKFLK